MKFRVGQLVELVDNSFLEINSGATAVVVRCVGESFAYIEWIGISKNKQNENVAELYNSDRFRPAKPIKKQLLFSFME